jgi:hypothetical protein
MKDEDNTCLDNMKQPAAILVQILVNTSIPVSAILADTGHCQNLSIVDTGRYCKTHNTGSFSILHPAILVTVILVLQNTQYWKL